MSRLVVYAGPTLPRTEILRIAPAAEVHPPIEWGSLGLAQLRAGDVVVVIDGYYRDRPSVRHKELLHVLRAGVTVLGAASMGAMRAAELSDFGMLGVGTVYQLYKDGEIWGDDEVAVKHSPETRRYEAESIALVSLRHGCQLAVADGVATASAANELVSAAREIVFYDRTWPILAAAVSGQPGPEALLRYCRGQAVDIKARDAALAIEYGRRLRDGEQASDVAAFAVRGEQPRRWTETTYVRDWMSYWRGASMGPSADWVSDYDVLSAARLYHHGYPAIHRAVLEGLLSDLGPDRHPLALLGLKEGDAVPDRLVAVLSPDERQLSTGEQAALVVARLWPVNICQDWRPSVLVRLKDHPLWTQWRDLVLAADEARNRGDKQIAAELCGLPFLRRWGASGFGVPRELARRGFLSFEGLNRTAKRFAALEFPRRQAIPHR